VTVIDWSTMLYGLTAFKRGMAFFALGREAAGERGGESTGVSPKAGCNRGHTIDGDDLR